jgi:hypothetical protein
LRNIIEYQIITLELVSLWIISPTIDDAAQYFPMPLGARPSNVDVGGRRCDDGGAATITGALARRHRYS